MPRITGQHLTNGLHSLLCVTSPSTGSDIHLAMEWLDSTECLGKHWPSIKIDLIFLEEEEEEEEDKEEEEEDVQRGRRRRRKTSRGSRVPLISVVTET